MMDMELGRSEASNRKETEKYTLKRYMSWSWRLTGRRKHNPPTLCHQFKGKIQENVQRLDSNVIQRRYIYIFKFELYLFFDL